MNWFKSRNTSAASEYQLSRNEMIKEREMENVFLKFDTDGSGTIGLKELYEMFLDYGVDINKDELKQLFNIVDSDGSGELSIEEFKKFSSDPLANMYFRKMVQRIRSEHEKIFGPHYELRRGYLPFNLTRLLDYLSHMSKRETLMNGIEKTKFEYDASKRHIKDFIKVFIIDGVAKDCLVKEDSAQIVDNAVKKPKKKESETLFKELKMTETNLDDKTLEQLSETVLNYQPPLERRDRAMKQRKTLENIDEDSFGSESEKDQDSNCSDACYDDL